MKRWITTQPSFPIESAAQFHAIHSMSERRPVSRRLKK
ncbi:hypothetical protein BSU04_35115 [Caballeronia sordidicola]|uniref:Uncharacterized protein n=1 Tax=Caballeronia sordidicola TaxID=196367 RepID=A0A226WRJ6_CABSO|nr:hypothetical protein BSU04_35115 [Caballeronia sordidicola]